MSLCAEVPGSDRTRPEHKVLAKINIKTVVWSHLVMLILTVVSVLCIMCIVFVVGGGGRLTDHLSLS